MEKTTITKLRSMNACISAHPCSTISLHITLESHRLNDELIFLALLLMLQELLPSLTHTSRQLGKQQLFRRIGQSKVSYAERYEEALKTIRHVRQIHQVVKPVRRVKEHIGGYKNGNNHGDDKRYCLALALIGLYVQR